MVAASDKELTEGVHEAKIDGIIDGFVHLVVFNDEYRIGAMCRKYDFPDRLKKSHIRLEVSMRGGEVARVRKLGETDWQIIEN